MYLAIRQLIAVSVQNFWSELKAHLWPCVKATLDAEGQVDNGFSLDSDAYQNALDGIHFKSNRMYCHNMMRFNYTTYDVR